MVFNLKRNTKVKRKEQKKMTKTFKKMISVIVTLVMVMAMATVAFAADENYSITITKNDTNDTATHRYDVYQIFQGQVVDNKLGNISWGADVKTTDTTLYSDLSTALGKTVASVDDVLGELTKLSDDHANLDKFAEAISKHLDGTPVKTATLKASASSKTVTITGVDAGYYLVSDTVIADASGAQQGEIVNPNAVSKFILQVASDTVVPVTTKEVLPSLDKKIKDKGGNSVSKNTASIGEDIDFEITTAVPDLTNKGYDEIYKFVITDTLSAGLTFKGASSVTVKLDGTELTQGNDTDIKDYKVVATADGFKIVFNSSKMYTWGTTAASIGDAIVVSYKATLNENAVITDAGNPNTAKLIYSNNPNEEYDGTTDDFGPDDPKGETPEVTTITYTTKVVLEKVDKNDHTKHLAGAVFTVQGTAADKVVINGTRYVADADGTYYKLIDGTYTTTPPETADDPRYDGNTKYIKESFTDVDEKQASESALTIEVGPDGKIDLSHLGAGTYTLTEKDAPAGYVKDPNPHTLIINCDVTGTNPVWSYTFDSNDIFDTDAQLPIIVFENKKPTDLPSTGGIGTTVFYVAGSVMLAAGAALIVWKKRLGSEEK